MSICVLRTVIRWLGPTAPWVSGGITVLLSGRARKLVAGAGERGAGPASSGAAALELSRGGDTLSPGSFGPGIGEWMTLGVLGASGASASRRARSVKLTVAFRPATPAIPACGSPAW